MFPRPLFLIRAAPYLSLQADEESTLAGSVKESQGKLAFKGRDMLIHCRLRDMGQFRGAGKAAAFGNGYEYIVLFRFMGVFIAKINKHYRIYSK